MIKVESSGDDGENGSETHSEVCTAMQTTTTIATDNKRRRSQQQQPKGQNRRHNMRQLTMTSVRRMQLKVTLERLIAEQDPSIRIVTPDKSTKSAVWDNNSFQMVFLDNIKQEFALCTECGSLVTYKSCYGTGSLIRHSCFRKRAQRNKKYDCPVADDLAIAQPSSSSASVRTSHADGSLKQTLETMIRNADPQVELIDGHSLEWKNYKNIYYGGTRQDYVFCILCSSTVSSRRKGTHRCLMENPSVKVENVKFQEITTHLPFQQQQEIAKQQLYFIYKDLVTPKSMESKGFQSLAQCLINIGALYGPMNVENVLIDSGTLRNQQNLIVETIRQDIRSVFIKYRLAFACDVWLDEAMRKKCMTISGHYIDDHFNLRRIVLGTRIFDSLTVEPSEMLNEVFHILRIYLDHNDDDPVVHKLLSRSVIVAFGNDPNLVECFKNYNRIDCTCNRLNTIAQRLIDDPVLSVEKICDEVKEVLEIVQHTKCDPRITELIDQFDAKKWSYVWELFSILKEDAIEKTIAELEITLPNFESIYKILQPFQKASISLGADLVPTICAVYIYRKKLEDTFSLSYFSDAQSIKEIKCKALTMIQNEFNTSDIHKIALFLDPRFKSLKFLDKEEKASVINMVKKLAFGDDSNSDLMDEDDDNNTDDDHHHHSDKSRQSGIIVKQETNQSEYLSEYMDDGSDDTELNSELNLYMNLKLNDIYSADILKFWQSRTDMPHLRQLAREILCIPASSSAADKVFSEDAKYLAKRRLYMEPADLDRILLIHGTSELSI